MQKILDKKKEENVERSYHKTWQNGSKDRFQQNKWFMVFEFSDKFCFMPRFLVFLHNASKYRPIWLVCVNNRPKLNILWHSFLDV